MMAGFQAGEIEYADIEEALERLQSLLLARVENKLGAQDELEYRRLRRALMQEPDIAEHLPRLVTVNSDMGGVWSVLREQSDQWEPRRMFIREQMRDALEFVRSGSVVASSSSWTGIKSPRERLSAARQLLPMAQATVEGLIAELERPQGNGGPLLDERADALEYLRQLHRVIGELLKDAERGAVKSLNQRLLDEATGYLSRFGQSVRDDPMPYMVSAGLFAIFAALGGGAIGGFLAGIAGRIKKNSGGA